MNDIIKSVISEHSSAMKLLEEESSNLEAIGKKISECLKSGGKVMICGNGGSAADSQHFSAELVGRFQTERRPLPAIALSTDTSILTAVGNDYGFERIFERQVEALGNRGDILIGISTSGNSMNVINAVEAAKKKGMTTIGFLGKDGGKLKPLCDMNLTINSKTTARVQEMHGLSIHIICEMVDSAFK